ncbi:Short-chain dehydrogenase/reductase SDR [Lasiodiplodia theobromae]|nr:Short-chain dehydrogenase/reductase SDR [Lasiodiplodia theobromae]
MYKQATLGQVDFITGDYLAEINLAANATAYASGQHPGYEPSALNGLAAALDALATNRIKVAINGGALNPRGLAQRVAALAREKGLDHVLRVAYVDGDDLREQIGRSTMPRTKEEAVGWLPHLDAASAGEGGKEEAFAFLRGGDGEGVAEGENAGGGGQPIVSANAYLGARGIATALRNGADIVIAGRVADASPVVAAAWYWWGWDDGAYDALAGALVAGHLIECSAYVSGGNFAGFNEAERYGGVDTFLEPGFPIAEVDKDGACVVTKHEGTGGVVDVETVRCQLLYELQGNVYLHSDVKAVLDGVEVEEVGKDRVRVSGIKGLPPPPTTKLAVFYKGGYECQILVNATGYGWREKCELFEKQVRRQLGEDLIRKLDILEFQRIGVPAENPWDQNSSTMYIRIVAQSRSEAALKKLAPAVNSISLRHFHGYHCSLDWRTASPKPYLAFYPALWPQSRLAETAHFVSPTTGETTSSHPAGHPPTYAPLGPRDTYDTASPIPSPSTSAATQRIRLGDIALARSGDKGGNLNVGIFVRSSPDNTQQEQKQWDWLRSYLSRKRMWELLGGDAAKGVYRIERVEFARIKAVHFVVYGLLGRGVSSATRLDAFGKGFADYFRDKVVEVPVEVLGMGVGVGEKARM